MSKRFSATNGVLGLLCVMYFITYLDRVNIATAGAEIMREFGMSKTDFGLILSAFAYPYAIFQVIGGSVGDKFGARRTLLACGVIWATATILTGMVGGLVSLFMARVLLGFGEGATFPTATRAMQNWTAPGRRGFAQGITHAFARLGNAVAPPIVAFLIYHFGWRTSFVILGAVSFFWVVAWWLYFRDDPSDHPAITARRTRDAAASPARSARSRACRGAPLTKRMLPVSITYFCYGWTLWLFLGWLPSFFKENYSLDLKNSALFASGVFFAGVVGDTVGGLMSDSILHRTGNVKLARLSVIVVGFLGAAAQPRGRVPDPRPDPGGAAPVLRLLLRRAGDRADLVGAHGHRAEICRHRQRADEHRLGPRGDRLADRLRRHRRPDRELDAAVRRFHRPVPARGRRSPSRCIPSGSSWIPSRRRSVPRRPSRPGSSAAMAEATGAVRSARGHAGDRARPHHGRPGLRADARRHGRGGHQGREDGRRRHPPHGSARRSRARAPPT